MSINIWVSSQHKVTLSSDYQDRCEGVFGKSSPLYEVHSPQIFENPCCTDSLWDAVFASITASMLCGRCIVSTSKKSTTAVQHHRGQGRCSRARRCCASSPWSFEKFCVTLTLTSNWWTQTPPPLKTHYSHIHASTCVFELFTAQKLALADEASVRWRVVMLWSWWTVGRTGAHSHTQTYTRSENMRIMWFFFSYVNMDI